MSRRLKYVKRPSQTVLAVQIALDTRGFSYKKWGTTQTCRRGDWLVDNGGDVYTVNRDSFARTYRRIAPGRYLKMTPYGPRWPRGGHSRHEGRRARTTGRETTLCSTRSPAATR